MMKKMMKNTILKSSTNALAFAIMLALLLTSTLSATFADKQPPADSAKVEGTFIFPASDASIKDVVLIVRLYEYNPLIADKGADLIEKVELKPIAHTKGKQTVATFIVGANAKIKPRMKYYVTVRGYLNGKTNNANYVYHGKPDQGGIGGVLTNGKPRKVKYVGKRLK